LLIDLHDVLRTKVIRNYLYFFAGIKGFKIDKGRKEKKQFIAGKNRFELKHSSERYKDVFIKAGFENFDIKPKSIHPKETEQENINKYFQENSINQNNKLIGIAPFAKHRAKMWGLDKVVQLIELLSKEEKTKVFLFGGGKEEEQKLSKIEKDYKNVLSVAGKLNLEQELVLISKLNSMITMDSSNMHIAALLGVKTYSIWGGTHPYLGFKALGQDLKYSIQIPMEKLSCRPCSIYGKNECTRKDEEYKCLEDIPAEQIHELISFKEQFYK